jgi:hypothetical protein
MQKNVQINEDKFIQDLGTGSSLVNFDRKKELIPATGDSPEHEVITAGEQYRINNPINYSTVVDKVVKENYKDGADDAALRKGIIDGSDPDFIAFNAFVELIKSKCRNEGI